MVVRAAKHRRRGGVGDVKDIRDPYARSPENRRIRLIDIAEDGRNQREKEERLTRVLGLIHQEFLAFSDWRLNNVGRPPQPWPLLPCCRNAAYAMFCSTVGGCGGSGDTDAASTRIVDACGRLGSSGGDEGREEGSS